MKSKNKNILPDIPDNPNYEITGDLVDHYWNLIHYIHDLVKASELKAGLVLSFYGIVLNIYFQHISTFVEMAKDDWLTTIFMVFWFALTLISIFYSFRCFFPIILGKYDKNVFFFRDVLNAYGDIKTYSRKLYMVSNQKEDLFGQLGEQVYVNSKIASIKFGYINKSIRFLAANVVLIFIFSLIYSVRLYI